ncbi:LLM class F420-dependent oxidoreductase [soil metagenome]
MKFALHFGNNTFPDFASAARLAKLAEEAGFDSVLAVDHVVFPDDYKSTYPYSATGRLPVGRSGAFPDPLIWIAYAAAVTTRLRFLTGVIILPQRDPFVLAKQVATLDYMSGGRFELGIGVGWLKEEFQAMGVPFEKRGKRADEYIAVMKALWAEDGASFAGEFVNFSNMSCNPKPAGRVPIIVVGHSKAAARRAGRLGDGFFPPVGEKVDTLPLVDVARRAAAEAGRDPGAIEMIAGCPDLLPGSTVEPQRALDERKKRGIDRIVLPVGPFMPSLEESLPRFGETVIQRFGEL